MSGADRFAAHERALAQNRPYALRTNPGEWLGCDALGTAMVARATKRAAIADTIAYVRSHYTREEALVRLGCAAVRT